MKRVVTMQDLSCMGKCSLTVALPVLSAMGVECAVLPTAVLSTHTAFPKPAVMVGMFQGGIQALSRSYMGKIIPAEQSGEYFGLMDICGKGASFVGTTLVAVVSQLTGNESIAVGCISIIFVIGFVLFNKADKECQKYMK